MNKFEMRFHHDYNHHDHCHCHYHSHGDDNESKEEKTLRVLLVHWVKHNQSHEESFREWVEKSKEMGKEEVASYIEKSIEYMQKANEMLIEAKKHM